MSTRTWATFAEQLTLDLASIEKRFGGVLSRSSIINVDPNRGSSGGFAFIGFAEWDWSPDDELIAERTSLLRAYDEWYHRFRILHRGALPEVLQRIADADQLIRRWLEREGGDHSVPSTVERAAQIVDATFAELRGLVAMVSPGVGGVFAVPDTSVLLRDPDVAVYGAQIGSTAYTVVLLPSVLSELDDLKDRGRTSEVRGAAERAVRRLKGLRDRGDLRAGVTVQGYVRLRAEHRDSDPREMLPWLDPTIPDDRLLGGALHLQAREPTSSVVLVTTDFNLQTKAAAAGAPFVEPPKPR